MPKKFSDLAAATALVDDDIFAISQSGTSKQIAASVFWLPTNYIGGLITSNGTDADHDIDIAPGIARSLDDSANMKLPAILTKQIDAVWAEGDDAGGLDAAPVVAADTLYAIWLIKNPTSGTVDALFSLSFTAPTMPAGYTKKRLIGAVMTDGSANILAYTQVGDYFRYMGSVPTDVDDNTMTAVTFEDGTLSAPPNCMAHIYANLANATETSGIGRLLIKTKGAGESASSAAVTWAVSEVSTDAFRRIGGEGQVLVDANSQVEYACSEAAGTAVVSIATMGFTMLTRRDP